jgi:hypothetical protein
MNKFYIDMAYVTSVTIRKQYFVKQEPGESTEAFLIRKLKNPEPIMTSTSSEDHPEFTKLRDKLEELKFITTQRNSWNGDRVIKPFYLNDVKFKKGDKFCCAAAITWDLTHGKVTL